MINGIEYRTNLQLGGQRYLPELFINNVVQFLDNLYFSTRKVDYTFGVVLMYTHLNSKATSKMNGRLYYGGLEAFRQNKPYRYAREVPIDDPTVKQSVLNSARYAQARMKPFRGGVLSIGLRDDYTTYFFESGRRPATDLRVGAQNDQ